MDSEKIIKKINDFASIVEKKFDCKEIILFGSFAKGTSHEESDIDVAVILNDFQNYAEVQLELMRIRRKIDSRIEPHLFKLSDFNTDNPLVSEIVKHGKRIEIPHQT